VRHSCVEADRRNAAEAVPQILLPSLRFHLAKPLEVSTWALGRAGPVCRRAFARFMEQTPIRTSFLLDIQWDRSEGGRGRSRFFLWRQGLPAVSGSPSCPRLQVPGLGLTQDPGLIRDACTDGERPFWGRKPRDRFEPRETRCGQRCAWWAGFPSVALPGTRQTACVRQCQGRAAGRNRRFPVQMTGRQPERACSGSSG